MMVAELKTAAEVRAHARAVQHRINQQKHPPPKPAPEPAAPSPPPQPPRQSAAPGNIVKSLLILSARHFNVPLAEVMGPKRDSELALARHVAFYVARRFGVSLIIIGRAAGRDHTSAYNGFLVVRDRLRGRDHATIEAVDAIGAVAAADLGLRWTPAEKHSRE